MSTPKSERKIKSKKLLIPLSSGSNYSFNKNEIKEKIFIKEIKRDKMKLNKTKSFYEKKLENHLIYL